MTDVRSLLRKERALRRIDHPFAVYSTTGTLECSVCKIPLKSEIEIWNKHLQSTQHAMRAERLRLSQKLPTHDNTQTRSITNADASNSKKRKAHDEDADSRKKSRPLTTPPVPDREEHNEASKPPSSNQLPSRTTLPPAEPKPASPPSPSAAQTIDEDEWAAFERDIAEPIPDSPSETANINAQAIITADPVSAADLAKQEEDDDPSSRKERREAELEAEKEDAARALEEEFDEMENLEERVRRLREKREGLRLQREAEGGDQDLGADGEAAGAAPEAVDEESTDEEDDFYGWSSRK